MEFFLVLIGAVFLVVAYDILTGDRPAKRPQRQVHDCGGPAECPVCLAAAIVAGVVIDDWLIDD